MSQSPRKKHGEETGSLPKSLAQAVPQETQDLAQTWALRLVSVIG